MPETTNSKVDNASIPLEVDGEVIYLNPNSAEGKALERIRQPISQQEWVSVEVEHEIDMEAVRQRLKQRGYKTQVSAKDQLTGH
jgi:hypothetical protein